jgi:sodium transport system permease protein
LLGARTADSGAHGLDVAAGPGVAAHRVTASDSLLLFAGACVLLFFVFFPLQARRLEVGLLVSEWGGMLGLVAIYARVTQQRLASVLVFTRPSGRALVGAALCGLSGWIVIGLLAEWIAPAPRELIERLRHQVAPPGGRGLAATLLLMAITPAVCEEALFRGPILRGLATRLSPLAAAAVTGVLFGLFHFDVWRFLPTALLGLMLSLIALRARSILPSMLAHGVNNGCLVTLAQLGVDEKMTTLGAASQIGIFVAASVALVAGGFLVGTGPATPSAPGERPAQM